MTRRQNNNQWSGGIAAHPSPKNFKCKNQLENYSLRFFWDQDGILLIHYLLKGQTINAECYLSLLVQLKDILKENRRRKFTKFVLFLHDNAPAHRANATRRNWPTRASNVSSTHPILRIWPRRTATCSLNWNKQLKVAFFRSTRSMLPRRHGWTDTFWIFFEWLAEERTMGYEVYWVSCGICCINTEFGRCSSFTSWSG